MKMKLDDTEKQIFQDAFGQSQKKTVAEREQDGFRAVEGHRKALKPKKATPIREQLKNRPRTIMEAVDQGVKDGSG
jgi:hypothetical protein